MILIFAAALGPYGHIVDLMVMVPSLIPAVMAGVLGIYSWLKLGRIRHSAGHEGSVDMSGFWSSAVPSRPARIGRLVARQHEGSGTSKDLHKTIGSGTFASGTGAVLQFGHVSHAADKDLHNKW